MRKLTVKRTKSVVACLMKMKIYIEDHSASELTINNVPCRKIGEIKNGEEKTFEISEQAVKVFVIVDSFSKDYCNDFYAIPEGQDDVYLTGKNILNPASGNAFRFDNNNNEEARVNRKRGTKKGVVALIVAIAIGFVVGFVITTVMLRL